MLNHGKHLNSFYCCGLNKKERITKMELCYCTFNCLTTCAHQLYYVHGDTLPFNVLCTIKILQCTLLSTPPGWQNWGHWVTVNIRTWAFFLNTETLERVTTPWQTCKVQLVFFGETTVTDYITSHITLVPWCEKVNRRCRNIGTCVKKNYICCYSVILIYMIVHVVAMYYSVTTYYLTAWNLWYDS